MKNKHQHQVLDIAKRGFNEGLVAATSGNYSIYDPQEDIMAITASGVSYPKMEIEDIILMSLKGEVQQGRGKPSSEWPMHAVIYESKKEVTAIVHTHSPYATALAVLHQELPVILIEMAIFLEGSVPLAQFALPGTRDLGNNAVAALEKGTACLLANHGVVAVGKNLEEAYQRAVYVEDAAKIYGLARSWGDPKIIPSVALQKMKKQ